MTDEWQLISCQKQWGDRTVNQMQILPPHATVCLEIRTRNPSASTQQGTHTVWQTECWDSQGFKEDVKRLSNPSTSVKGEGTSVRQQDRSGRLPESTGHHVGGHHRLCFKGPRNTSHFLLDINPSGKNVTSVPPTNNSKEMEKHCTSLQKTLQPTRKQKTVPWY